MHYFRTFSSPLLLSLILLLVEGSQNVQARSNRWHSNPSMTAEQARQSDHYGYVDFDLGGLRLDPDFPLTARVDYDTFDWRRNSHFILSITDTMIVDGVVRLYVPKMKGLLPDQVEILPRQGGDILGEARVTIRQASNPPNFRTSANMQRLELGATIQRVDAAPLNIHIVATPNFDNGQWLFAGSFIRRIPGGHY